MQTALLKVYRRWSRVSQLKRPAAYTRCVVVTTHTSWRRRLSTTEQVIETVPDRANPHGSAEVDHDLRTALQTLPPRMRAAVVLRFLTDLTEEQTAHVMGCSASTVKTHLTRGLTRLRAVLAGPTTTAATTIATLQEDLP